MENCDGAETQTPRSKRSDVHVSDEKKRKEGTTHLLARGIGGEQEHTESETDSHSS